MVTGTLLGPAACWKVAPDSDNQPLLMEGSVETTLVESILVTPDTSEASVGEEGSGRASGKA